MDKTQAKKILYGFLGNYLDKGDELLFRCPACDHHKRKLSVNLDKNVFKCWVCDYHGRNIRRLVRRFGTFVQLQKWNTITGGTNLQDFYGLFDCTSNAEDIQTIDLPSEFMSLCSPEIPKTGVYALKYLKERGISRADILKWKIGYCFSGEYRDRVIVPSFNDDGNVNYFIARSYKGDSYKYKNPRVSKDVVFNELYVDWSSDLTLVEGVFDAIVAGNGVPILGSTLREDSKLIQKIVMNDTPVYMALDPDAAHKERAIISTLLKYDIELYKIDISGYEDVGSMSREVFQQRKNNATFIDRDDYLLLDLLSAV